MNSEKNFQEKIIEEIKKGAISMKPKWYFVAKGIILALGTALVTFTAIYVTSFTIFTIKQTGLWFMPSFGGPGWMILLIKLPWILIVLSIIFMFVVEFFVKKYTLAYRYPLLYSALGVIIIALIGGSIINQQKIHTKFLAYANKGDLPIIGGVYKNFGLKRPENIQIGTIVDINEKGLMLEDPRSEIINISTSSQTKFPRGYDFVVGDRVVVFGEKDSNNNVYAKGIKKIDDEFGPELKIKRKLPPPQRIMK